MPQPRLVIIGLDCAELSLVERWRFELPNLSRLMECGSYGRLESCIPAITVPAWSCMTSGRDPGELGIYGFRNRVDRSYNKLAIANSSFVNVPRLWDIFGDVGWKVAVLGVPGTYPPPSVNGALISGFLTPNTDVQFTQPAGLGMQVRSWVERYLFDVPDFRTDDKPRILRDIYDLCNQSFTLALHLLDEYEPDLLMLVEMGMDRLHHAFWKHMDPRHPLHVPDSPHANVIYDYYCHVDRCIGKLLERCGDPCVWVVSDHGAQPLMGGFCLNQWLIETGYLVLKEIPVGSTRLQPEQVDWSRTKAWGAGGYYGRIFMNVKDREPEGAIAISDYQQARRDLQVHLEAIAGPDGNSLGVRAYTPQGLYKRVRGVAPDLIVYFQDLAWRSLGSVGVDSLYSLENDTGPDDANHAQCGLLVHYDPQHPGNGCKLTDAQIYDVLPTLCDRWNIAPPAKLRGKSLGL